MNIIELLKRYSYRKRRNYYFPQKFLQQHLVPFLDARMDEVRLIHAEEFSKEVLRLIDVPGFNFFRQSVLRKEIGGDILYPKQRDHSAHTLYNYLLGWYLFDNIEIVNKSFDHAFKQRNIKLREFGNFWPFVSLLHDIGYMFEGFLHPLSNSNSFEQITVAANIYNEYFQHNLWNACSIYSHSERDHLLNLAKLKLPQIRDYSISSIANSLQIIPVSDFEKDVITNNTNKRSIIKSANFKNQNFGISVDVFDLWSLNYSSFDNPKMAKRIVYLRKYFDKLITEGYKKSGIRLLDHAICSGLILIQANSFYYKLYYLLDKKKNDLKGWDKHFVNMFLNTSFGYQEINWWKKWLWVTASCAFHNFQQSSDDWDINYRRNTLGPLSIHEDPYAYLAILVDILQEWDRYTVIPISVITKELPVQGIDIEAELKNNILRLKYPRKQMADDIEKSLDASLANWRSIVRIS